MTQPNNLKFLKKGGIIMSNLILATANTLGLTIILSLTGVTVFGFITVIAITNYFILRPLQD